jgi:carboxylesterase type B
MLQLSKLRAALGLPADVRQASDAHRTSACHVNRQQTSLSDQLVTAWANFARTGNPNGSGNSPWPRYTAIAESPAWLIQDLPGLSTMTDAQYSALRHCDFWDSVTATQ